MTLRAMLGSDVEHIQEQIDALLDRRTVLSCSSTVVEW